MSDKHVFDDLSAYIDGEAGDAHRVARHLQSCPDCARRHVELLKLSNHVRAMAAPSVDNGFAGRVLARVEADGGAPAWRRLLELHPWPLLAVAAMLLLVGSSVVLHFGSNNTPATERIAVQTEDALVSQEEEIVALNGLMEADLWMEPVEFEDVEEDLVSDPTIDVLLDALALDALDDEFSDWYEPEDLTSVLESLAMEDVGVLIELTKTHWDKV